MPATAKATKRPSAPPRVTEKARARLEQSDRTIGRIGESLAAAQKDLSAIGDSLGSGANNLGKDVTKLLRDARRDVTKMSRMVRRDLTHLQKDLSAASGAKPRRGGATSSRAKAKTGTSARAGGRSA